MKTVKDAFDRFKTDLTGMYSTQETDAITSLLLSDLTGKNKGWLKAFDSYEMSAEQSQQLLNALEQLKTGKPIQYILGHTEFYGLNFMVNPSVLIPRPETEELVEWVLASVDRETKYDILDMGTGSGCIPICLKKFLPASTVASIDLSAEALQTAERNAELNQVDVKFLQADILNLAEPEVISKQYNVIVSNPPYVTMTDKGQMHQNVTNFEPHTALFVSNEQPLIFYEAIAGFAHTNLTKNGFLFFEINESYGNKTVDMLSAKGFVNIELRQDMTGKDRMIKAMKT
ncbi:peptide chain release factor N(5)-glutamine methyltransferase [Mucilaginibacter sp. PAMB04168]|uniref:peptide chain release factor N(5)-glutamine methyltransferase n=1 Tax=Mucilaginibacter sp. PAMB04168 TaxID=3138567 RepID=UPI0031F6FB0D